MSSSDGSPTAVPCARTVLDRFLTAMSASMHGVLAEKTALYWSLDTFSPDEGERGAGRVRVEQAGDGTACAALPRRGILHS